MFYFGVDYYPEHWPKERWSEDAQLMAEADFNVVSLAEFAWSKLGSNSCTAAPRDVMVLLEQGNGAKQ